MMIRENQMLRQRIRELGEHRLCVVQGLMLTENPERQVTDLTANSSITREPATPSHLTRGVAVSEETAPAGITPGAEDVKDE